MKKIVGLLFISVLLITGCSIRRLDNNISDNIKTILSDKTNLYNVHFEGYKYYVPRGLKFLEKEDYNALFRDQLNTKYYLYVDAISYYHKITDVYKINKSAYYSKKLNYSKTGYIEINKVGKKYFVEIMYNYGKIEAYTTKSDLIKTVDNSLYILKSIKYNDKVLDSIVGTNVLNYKESSYNIFQTESSKDTFLDYVKEYDKDATKSAKDEDKIKVSNNE
jgi:hypothetical protein